ncbi:AAA domain-containing protein [Flavobacterium chryseum]|uniref:AAA family ATPase n=1 Tax=Flavobacterium sp. P3160 TaxID=2512113 RepID=UPI00105B6E7D|nr:AAA family ATPase [Flavobacterium sp. P3160]TDO67863.1 AAA domain-containing protein [Flavobacterium sp. P3160]
MKSIEIKGLILTNFKGIVKLKVNFQHNTDVFGANGTGKSTIYDAFLWLLFGKNAEEKKEFSIKNTVDTSLNRQDHEVEGMLQVDGDSVTLKKIYKEKWTKKRGEEIAEYTGNETIYYWNDVPMQQKEFQQKVYGILDETVFKLITNPYALNSLKWQDRRGILTQMSGELSNEEIASGNPEYEALVANLTQGKTMEDYLKQIKASVKKSKDDLKQIPTRIDEVSKTKPEAYDFTALKNVLAAKETQLSAIDVSIQDKSKGLQSVLEANETAQRSASNLRSEISNIEIETMTKASNSIKKDTSIVDALNASLKTKQGDLLTAKNGLVTLKGLVTAKESDISTLDITIQNKREEWVTENAKELSFDDNSFCCPTCKRNFEESDIETKKTEMSNNFKTEKSNKLTEINRQGGLLKTQKENLEAELSGLKVQVTNGENVISNLEYEITTIETRIKTESANDVNDVPVDATAIYNELLDANEVYKANKLELETVSKTIQEVPKVDDEQLKSDRNNLVLEMDDIKTKLRNESQIKLVNDRITALKEEETKLAQEIAGVEKTQFLIERFEKDKMTAIEDNVNSKFKIVKFKMFEDQVNGGENPACEIYVNGVPFSDANTASKINAGIDIISTLSKFYQVSAPIFIDGAESIHDIMQTDSQMIRLVVLEDLSFSEDKIERDTYYKFIDKVKNNGGLILDETLKSA